MDGKDFERSKEEHNNDQDIEKKIREQSEATEIPKALKPESIEKLLEERSRGNGRQGNGQTKGTRRWKPVYGLAAAACCVIIIGAAAAGVHFGAGGGETTKPAVAEDTADRAVSGSSDKEKSEKQTASGSQIVSARDYDEVYDYLKAETDAQADSYGHIDESVTSGAKADSSSSANSTAGSGAAVSSDSAAAQATAEYSETNIRQEGVGEGDIVKTDGKNLYIVNNQKIQIVGIGSDNMEELGTIKLKDSQYVSELYIKDDKLVFVYTKSEAGDTEASSQSGSYMNSEKQYTVAATYDVSDPAKPELLGEFSQSGNFHTMRIVGDYVYLFSDFYAQMPSARDYTGSYIPEMQGKSIASSDILLPQYARGSQYTVVSAFSMKDPSERTDGKAIFGSAGMCYVSTGNIYICESYYNSEESDVTQTCIRKIAYKDGKLETVGQTKVDGTLNDSFSIDEYEGNLRLVTTVNATGSGSAFPIVAFGRLKSTNSLSAKDTNSLYILDEKLKKTGEIEGLAEDEQVYSARFLGDTGYFVTYRQTDPLFSADLSNPKEPKVIGELKIPGFSEYLHLYGEGLLLGIGMDVDETGTSTEGVKMSMFDISDPSDVKEIDKEILDGSYSTNIGYNYKAALIDTEKNLIGFAAYSNQQHYYVYSYEKGKGFTCLFDRELSGMGDGRGLYAGDTFYLVDGNTVQSFDLNTFEKIDDIVL